MVSTRRGTPISRSSSLSRSNARLNDASSAGYPGTLARRSSALMARGSVEQRVDEAEEPLDLLHVRPAPRGKHGRREPEPAAAAAAKKSDRRRGSSHGGHLEVVAGQQGGPDHPGRPRATVALGARGDAGRAATSTSLRTASSTVRAVVGDAAMALARVAARAPEAGDGTPAEPRCRIEAGRSLEPGEAQVGAGAGDAGAHGHDDHLGVEAMPGEGQRCGTLSASTSPPKACPAVTVPTRRSRSRSGHEIAHRQRQGRAVGHHVGHAGARAGVGDACARWRGAGCARRRPPRACRRGRRATRPAPPGAGVDLEAGVAELHEVPGSGLGPRGSGEVAVHDVPPAAPQAEVDGGGVDHHLVACGHGPVSW
jgi:hypothetical protein